MREEFEDAKSELKRVDHLIYVSLKYTRTVDVFKSIIERLINSYGFLIEGILAALKDKKKVSNYPPSPLAKAELMKKLFKEDPNIISAVERFLLLRKIDKADFTRAREFRKHVTMTVTIDGQVMNLKMDTLYQYYADIKAFVAYAEEQFS